MKLSLCIANTNNVKMLDRALNSIFQNPPDYLFEVLVVDNLSTDGSAELVRIKYPQVILTENKKRLGYPANCNINILRAKGEYILLLNEDVEILPDSLNIGIKYLEEHLDVGLLGCCMLYPNGKIMFTSGRKFPTLLSDFLGWTTLSERFPNSHFFGSYLMSYWPHDTILEVETIQEAGMFARRQSIDEVGMLDENLFFCFDGPEWTQRFWKAGKKVVYHPDVRIIHYHGQSSNKGGKPNYFLLIESMRSGQYYYDKYHGHFYAMFYRLVMAFIFLLYVIKHSIFGLFFRNKVLLQSLSTRRETALIQMVWYLGGDPLLKLVHLG